MLPTYLATAAPDLTFWDAPELAAAARTLGIPHPPGTPLWVLLAHVASRLFAVAGPVRGITLLSVVTTVAACALGAAMASRWLPTPDAATRALAGTLAGVGAGTMATVWANATETEVYAPALLLGVGLLAAGARAGRVGASARERRRWRALIAFLTGLALPLHLSGLVALPAAVALAWRGPRPRVGEWGGWLALAALGASAVAVLPIRAALDPALNSGDPRTWSRLLDVLRRTQYDVPGLWPRRAPWWLQVANVGQWADWQVALGLHPRATPGIRRTPLTLAWALLGLAGLRAAWRADRHTGRALLVLLAAAWLGVVAWLNLRPGPSFGAGVLPADAAHEARERDYFFALAFWSWGLLAGAGLAAGARRLAERIPRGGPVGAMVRVTCPLLAIALGAVPLVVNWRAVDRTREPEATLPRTVARLLLEATPPNGVLLLAGDNDSFPLWYLQLAEEVRPDVVPVTVPLLGADWYRAQLAKAGVLPPELVDPWPGLERLLPAVASYAERAGRPLRASVLLAATDRRQVAPGAGWVLEGFVWAPSGEVPAGGIALAPDRQRAAATQVPRSALAPLRPGVDPVAAAMQALLGCATVTQLDDPRLVSVCNGT